MIIEIGILIKPKYPLYIISKGRWESRLTSKVLEKMCVPYWIVIEPQEYKQYAAVIDPAKILILPFSNLGQGSIPARNWVWEHSVSEGHERHWIVDDNIRRFWRLNRNSKVRTESGAIFAAMEEFVDRYENIAMAGPNYYMFAWSKNDYGPFRMNVRIYSCILIKNDLPYRWRGRYNEDTDLSLRVLKDGWCTMLFMAFLAEKAVTMTMKGGNTEALYKLQNADGRLIMAQSLQAQHPDIVKITRKWGRWQHQVDYRPFKANKLIKKPGIVIPEGINEYGMKLVKADDG
jgi:DNA-directed RNA polymerase subunit H (RpoH/RPB5)